MLKGNLEDFLEAALRLQKDGWASTEKVAQYMGVRLQSAYVSLKKLKLMELLEIRDNAKEIKLTKAGEAMAREVNRKHDLIKSFLHNFLCVPEDAAELDAHNMEHIISDEALDKMLLLMEFVEKDPEGFLAWFSRYKSLVCSVK